MKILRNAFALLMALCLSTTAFAAEDDPMMIIHGKTGTEESVEWVNTYLGQYRTEKMRNKGKCGKI